MSADLLLSRDKDQTLAQLSMNPAVFPVVFLQRYERQKMVDNMNHMIHIVNHIEIRQINNHCTQTAGRPTRTEFRYVTCRKPGSGNPKSWCKCPRPVRLALAMVVPW